MKAYAFYLFIKFVSFHFEVSIPNRQLCIDGLRWFLQVVKWNHRCNFTAGGTATFHWHVFLTSSQFSPKKEREQIQVLDYG